LQIFLKLNYSPRTNGLADVRDPGHEKPPYLSRRWIERFNITGGEGFEPSQADPESAVLPLHNPPFEIKI
jgi:hypothetical protein